MATKNRNNIIEDGDIIPKQERFPHDTTGNNDYNQGDMLWFDASVHQVKALDSATHAATFVGIAARAAFIAPYTATQVAGGPTAQKNYELSALVARGCIAELNMSTSDAGQTYYDGDLVYFSTDAQTITKQATVPANSVGVIKLADGVTSIAYVAGGKVPVRIIAQYPIASL